MEIDIPLVTPAFNMLFQASLQQKIQIFGKRWAKPAIRYPAWGLQTTGEPDTLSDIAQQASGIKTYLEMPGHKKTGFIALLHNGRYHTVLAMQMLQYWSIRGWKFVTTTQIAPIYQSQ